MRWKDLLTEVNKILSKPFPDDEIVFDLAPPVELPDHMKELIVIDAVRRAIPKSPRLTNITDG